MKETTLGRNGLRWSIPIIAFVLGLTSLTGCAIDKGSALAADFEEDWAGTPDVVKIDTTRNNTLPFLGTASGVLILKDGTSADRVTELANKLGEYVAGHDNTTGRITADGITFTVVADRTRAGKALALWHSLTDDHRVVNGDIKDAPWKEKTDRWEIKVTAVNQPAAMAVFKDMMADGDQHQPLSRVTSLEVSTERGVRPSLRVETDFNDGFPAEAIAAYDAVVARYRVVGATLRRDRATGSVVSIVVADSADLDRAGELARTAAPTLGAAVKVTSDGGD
ncbi:hypothetical protein [Plantactinospora sp. CA-290183]|uniref:hypothetical protein n=1 Tax=Plantactinospora sp. CA-290183 TaxID=3240006 RepID=UPI003D8E4142